MTIVIIGAGAIGRLFGFYLSRGGHEVLLVEKRPEVVAAVNDRGLGLVPAQADTPDNVSYTAAVAYPGADRISRCDLVILAVKSFDTLAAVQAAAHLVARDSPVITLQTGLGNIEVLERVVDRRHIIGGFTFMAGTALGPGIVRHGGMGKTYLGELDGAISERLRKVTDLFSDCGLPCSPVHRIMGRLWCKVIVYAAINGLTSILQVKNGRLLDAVESITLLKRLIDEGRRVAEARAVDLVFHDLYRLLFDACRRTEGNLSSMLQDILNGRRTEIDAQCGALVRFAEEAGVAAPTQQTVVELVKLMEMRSRSQGRAIREEGA